RPGSPGSAPHRTGALPVCGHGTTAQVVVRYLPDHSQSNSMNLVSYATAPVCRTVVEKAPRPGGMLRLAAVGLRRAVAGGKRVLPGSGQVREEELDLALGRVGGVRTVDDVGLDVETVVAADGAGSGEDRVGGARQGAERLDRPVALHHHGDQRAAGDELHQRREERLFDVLLVMRFRGLFVQGAQLHGDDLEALALDTGDDLADDVAPHAIGLDQDKGALHGAFLLETSLAVYGAAGPGAPHRCGALPPVVGTLSVRRPLPVRAGDDSEGGAAHALSVSWTACCAASTRRPRTTPAIHSPTNTMPKEMSPGTTKPLSRNATWSAHAA